MVIRDEGGGVLWSAAARCAGALFPLQVELQAILDGMILAEM